MTNVISLNREAAKRERDTIQRVVRLMVPEEARKARSRRMLMNVVDEMLQEFGSEHTLSELSGATVAVEAFHDMTKA